MGGVYAHGIILRKRPAQPMSYRNRMTLSALVSVALNAMILALPWNSRELQTVARRAPIELRLLAEPAESEVSTQPSVALPPQVIETVQEANRPPKDTNLLSDKDSNASDLKAHEGTHPGPEVEEESRLAAVPSRGSNGESEPAPLSVAMRGIQEKSKPQQEPSPSNQATEDQARHLDAESLEDMLGEFPSSKPAARTQTAQVAPPASAGSPQHARGQIDGRAIEQGFVGFEAIRDEVAAYYLECVKPRIRKNWITNMLTRYSGVSRAVAEVEMAITKEGALAYAEVRGHPSNRIYAALCKLSIEQAAPFKPFPFRVPPEYRDQNLVVRCTFHWQ